jgi:hypothetical protein
LVVLAKKMEVPIVPIHAVVSVTPLLARAGRGLVPAWD